MGAGGCSSIVDNLPGMHKALASIFSTTKESGGKALCSQ